MINEIKHLAEQNGYKLEFFPAQKMKLIEQQLTQFLHEPSLNIKQIKNVRLQFPYLQAIEQTANKYVSVIIVAVPRRDFENHKKAAATLLKNAVKKAGFIIKSQSTLPFKRVAVQSGLAKYGRNNITYVDGMGSWCKYLALLTNIPCDGSSWREQPIMATECENCELCINNCPTGAITKDRFLLIREKCIGGGGCSACQDSCPMNKTNK